MAPRSERRAYGGAADYPRTRRINKLLHEVLAEEIERLADADERLRLLTITEVATSPDLRNATVFVASLGEEQAEALEERRSALQGVVARQSHLKRTPRLRFEQDPAVVHGTVIDEALRRLAGESSEEH
jgi:ribosome-binding factor A